MCYKVVVLLEHNLIELSREGNVEHIEGYVTVALGTRFSAASELNLFVISLSTTKRRMLEPLALFKNKV